MGVIIFLTVLRVFCPDVHPPPRSLKQIKPQAEEDKLESAEPSPVIRLSNMVEMSVSSTERGFV